MNSTKKGDLFEEKVYNLILEALMNDKLFVSPKHSLLFKKKEYYSKDRGKEIVFDLAIECYREGSEQPSFIVLIECKDYQTPISVDNLEEFYSKKQQIARANSKCLFFTTNSLQVSAFNYATNIGIGVVRIMDDDSMIWLIERANKNLSTSTINSIAINVTNAITDEYFVSTHKNVFAYLNEKAYTSIAELIQDVFNEI